MFCFCRTTAHFALMLLERLHQQQLTGGSPAPNVTIEKA
jgi:hypothetical protein